MSHNVVFIMDWSNISRAVRDMHYQIGDYDKDAGFVKLKAFLSSLGKPTRLEVYTPIHDVYGHFEFLRDHDFTIVLCPIVAHTSEDTTDQKLIDNALDLISNYQMEYFCLGSGDKHFNGVLQAAKNKGIKTAVVYGSDRSLSGELMNMADEYPENHEKRGEKMLHLFSPTKNEAGSE